MFTIAMLSQKGGVGKSNMAIHLAAAAGSAGRVSLIIDADPQATATRWSEWRGGKDPEVISCPSSTGLSTRARQAAEMGCEICVIDTAPHSNDVALAAAKLADLIIIPCRPRAFDLDAVRIGAELIRSLNKPAYVAFSAGPQKAPLLYRDAAEFILSLDVKLAPFALSERAAYYHAAAAGEVAGEYEPGGKASFEVQAMWQWCEMMRQTLRLSAKDSLAA